MNILIAEDDVVSRRLLEATLTRYGYEVLATGTAPRPDRFSKGTGPRTWPSWTG